MLTLRSQVQLKLVHYASQINSWHLILKVYSLRYIWTTGWRKISFYFNLSYEIKDKTIEFDENRNVQRAEFIVRAYMQYVSLSVGY